MQLQNIGNDYLCRKFLCMTEQKLKLKHKLLTTHYGRRFGATSLADTGILITNPMNTGQWKSMKLARVYLENSKAAKKDQAEMLDAGYAIAEYSHPHSTSTTI
eukprot:909853-Ditylum_brightwellii.AAC.1